ncbi:hypothetical protein [Psychromicrobium xiongbiense]|uniref:hypothetical protein n=1 Tax=Psychromicrobium xiongbiense TaxID=3051184 RepID=UPI0025533BEA|nr:hypothetical protein [Psychromicrobium sp. YIM S02556]
MARFAEANGLSYLLIDKDQENITAVEGPNASDRVLKTVLRWPEDGLEVGCSAWAGRYTKGVTVGSDYGYALISLPDRAPTFRIRAGGNPSKEVQPSSSAPSGLPESQVRESSSGTAFTLATLTSHSNNTERARDFVTTELIDLLEKRAVVLRVEEGRA